MGGCRIMTKHTGRSLHFRKSRRVFTKKLSSYGLKWSACGTSSKLCSAPHNRAIHKSTMIWRTRKATTPIRSSPLTAAVLATGVLSD